jgi:hypothetical protein
MRRNRLLFFFLLCLFLASCQKKKDVDLSKSNFIYLKDNEFKLHGETFFPMMLNWVPSFQCDENGKFIVAPDVDYDSVGYVDAYGKAPVTEQINGQFQLISELGFNTLRVCCNRIARDDHGLYYQGGNRKFRIGNEADESAIIEGLSELMELARAHDLRVMLLIHGPIGEPTLESFTIRLLQHFSNDPTLFAYDFMNEPLYFDPVEKRTKTDAVKIVDKWRKMMWQYAPNQLFTIGFSEPLEVFEWDPAMLAVDFVEFHTYHPLRVPSEIYWYSRYVDKPWMIGETALPADGDSITYEEQTEFMVAVYQLVRDAGGCGFGWWAYQDISKGNFEAQYTGLLNHEGRTTTADGRYTLQGTVKPAALKVKELSLYHPRPTKRPINFYNMLGYKNIRITGTILDMRTRQPIEGAVVRGWSEWWNIGMNTYTDENGRFTLYCNQPCMHFEVSAPGTSKLKFNKRDIRYRTADGRPVSASDLYGLTDSELEYHHISHHPFRKEGGGIFDFKEDAFGQWCYTGDMGTLLLVKER